MQRDAFSPDLESLLAPVPGAEPCGPSVRYDPAFLALRQSRVEDDASLPMREWERPLTKADWRAVANNCTEMLGRSKDLQLAAWLCDAWVRQHQIEGLSAAADLLNGLVERYWDGLHPLIDDGDSDARVAPFVWMNESLPMTLRLHVPLMFLPDQRPPVLNLADWDQIISASSARNQEDEQGRTTRDDLIAMADSRNLHWLSALNEQLQEAQPKWDALARALDDRLALDAPSLAKVADTLRKLQRACVSLLDGRNPNAPPAAQEQAASTTDIEPNRYDQESSMTPIAGTAPASAQPGEAPVLAYAAGGAINSRQDAYRMLEAAAAYLQKTEPHSPTPYLVKRAVTWGQMSLADLMQEILREEGDLTRYFSLLGLSPRD